MNPVHAEQEAEDKYVELKQWLSEVDQETKDFFWLKALWYSRWRVPYKILDRVAQLAPDQRTAVYMHAHIYRPEWIRGEDAFDRGEIDERLDVPL